MTVLAPDTPGDYFVASPASATVVVADNDTPGVSIVPRVITLLEADDPTTSGVEEQKGTYQVYLNAPPDAGVTVTVTPMSDDTSAVTVSPSSLEFTASDWSDAQPVTLTGVADNVENAGQQRTATVTHGVRGSGNYGSVTAGDVTVTIEDRLPVLSVTSGEVLEGDSGTVNLDFTVTLTPASTRTVTVDYFHRTAGDNPAQADVDYTPLPPGKLTFAAGETEKTVSVVVKGDLVVEPDETVEMAFILPVNAVFADGATRIIARGIIKTMTPPRWCCPKVLSPWRKSTTRTQGTARRTRVPGRCI